MQAQVSYLGIFVKFYEMKGNEAFSCNTSPEGEQLGRAGVPCRLLIG